MQIETRFQERCRGAGGVAELAKRLGIGTSTMYSYTSGRILVPDVRLQPLAEALNTSTAHVRKLSDEAREMHGKVARAKKRLRQRAG